MTLRAVDLVALIAAPSVAVATRAIWVAVVEVMAASKELLVLVVAGILLVVVLVEVLAVVTAIVAVVVSVFY